MHNYTGGHPKNSRIARSPEVDAAAIHPRAGEETIEQERERNPERVERLRAAGYDARLVWGFRIFVGSREVAVPWATVDEMIATAERAA
jgi:hypothetical protein